MREFGEKGFDTSGGHGSFGNGQIFSTLCIMTHGSEKTCSLMRDLLKLVLGCASGSTCNFAC